MVSFRKLEGSAVVVRQMPIVAEHDPQLGSLRAAAEYMQAIIDAYITANFLDEQGCKRVG